MNLWESGKRDRRRRILEAARCMVAADGIDGLSMRSLATRAGVSVATLYNLHGSKEDILVALAELTLYEQSARLEEIGVADPLDRAAAIIEISVEMFTSDPDLHRPLLSGLVRSKTAPGVSGLAERCVARIESELEAAVARRQLGQPPSPQLLAYQIFMSYTAALDLWVQGAIDAAQFRAQGLLGCYMALLAAAAPRIRPRLKERLEEQARILGSVDKLWLGAPAAPRSPKKVVS